MLLVKRRLLLLTFILVPFYGNVRGTTPIYEQKIEVIPQPTIANIYYELVRLDICEPDIVIRQVIAETRWLKCKRCSLQFNNLFGFLTKSGYLKFSNWKESVAYYKQWQNKTYRGGDYYAFLQNIGYATAPNYIRLLKQIDPKDFI